jgi:hypothetical protein
MLFESFSPSTRTRLLRAKSTQCAVMCAFRLGGVLLVGWMLVRAFA